MKTNPLVVGLVSLCVGVGPLAFAQAPAPTPAPSAQNQPAAPAFKQEELDAMLAPIALYPDALLSQMLMASTYPLEIVEAARWQKENAGLKDKALDDALVNQQWDESVKSLCAFPDVLQKMNKDLAWTQKLGDAFLAQQAQMMDTIQSLRQKAQTAGNLKSNEQQKVEVQTQDSKQYIVIEPANPQVVYVPTYQPTVVYGPWWYPSYPPYYPTYWAPPGAAFVSGFFWGAGIAAGAALWGGWNWNNHDVNINVNRYNSFNRTNISNGNWNHNVNHRGAVPYRDNGSRNKYGRNDRQAAQAREQFRGREGTLGGTSLNDRSGPNNANRGQANLGDRGQGNLGDRGQGNVGNRGQGAQNGVADRSANRGQGGGGTRPDLGVSSAGSAERNFGGGSAGNRGGGSGNAGGAFGGGNGGQARAASNRGHSSMGGSAGMRGGGGGGGGAARGGGGGGRGGGHGGGRR